MPRYRRPIRRPDTSATEREAILTKLMAKLYDEHIFYWNVELRGLITKNCEYNGRQPDEDHGFKGYGMFYAGKPWFVPWGLSDEASEFEIVSLHPNMEIEHAKELVDVTSNVAELAIERYEVSRFLAGLVIFTARKEDFEEALGPTLSNKLSAELEQLDQENQNYPFDGHAQEAFRTFINDNAHLIDQLNGRVMINLIAADVLRIHDADAPELL